jgi:hypothetical protein
MAANLTNNRRDMVNIHILFLGHIQTRFQREILNATYRMKTCKHISEGDRFTGNTKVDRGYPGADMEIHEN